MRLKGYLAAPGPYLFGCGCLVVSPRLGFVRHAESAAGGEPAGCGDGGRYAGQGSRTGVIHRPVRPAALDVRTWLSSHRDGWVRGAGFRGVCPGGVVSHFVSGRSPGCLPERAARIAEVLDVPVDVLFREKVTPDSGARASSANSMRR